MIAHLFRAWRTVARPVLVLAHVLVLGPSCAPPSHRAHPTTAASQPKTSRIWAALLVSALASSSQSLQLAPVLGAHVARRASMAQLPCDRLRAWRLCYARCPGQPCYAMLCYAGCPAQPPVRLCNTTRFVTAAPLPPLPHPCELPVPRIKHSSNARSPACRLLQAPRGRHKASRWGTLSTRKGA